MERLGRYTLKLSGSTGVIGSAAVGAKLEGEGPLSADFDFLYPNDGIESETWEQAESELHKKAVTLAIQKSGKPTAMSTPFLQAICSINAQVQPLA